MSRTAIPLSGISPPGFNAPTAGFEQPFEMLGACHERVERTLLLLVKLVDHVEKHGCDEQAHSAATDVLRYFDIAAPMHHDDEELHVFPLLLAQGDAALSARVHRMQEDHVLMGKRWSALRPLLVTITVMSNTDADLAKLRKKAQAFFDTYASHMETEEQILFPVAARLKQPDELQRMGDDMRRRRSVV